MAGKPAGRRRRRKPWRGEHPRGQGSAVTVNTWRVGPLPGRRQPLESRPPGLRAGRRKRQERRGPERGAAGREEQGPEGRTPGALRWSTGRCQARRGASRREGSQTLRAEGAGAWRPRVIRTRRAGMCCRGRNSRRVVVPAFGPGEGRLNRTLQGRAKRMIGAVPARRCGRSPRSGKPQGGRNREGGALNRIGATGGGADGA
jgi:hypothetical protein